jgi:hypothetical protein
MAKFYSIPFQDMHEFLANQGFKLLNPPKSRTLPDFVKPEHKTNNPSPEFYGTPTSPPTLELVYGRRVYMQGDKKQLTLRIYTSIDAQGTREKGSDAIRVTLFYRGTEIKDGQEIPLKPKLIGGERRCHRVQGWKKNLQARIDNWPELIGPPCPKCGNPTVERESARGKFWGCVRYSTQQGGCNGTINFGQENAPQCSCGKVMVERNGKNGKFLGCSGYPLCRNTKEVA